MTDMNLPNSTEEADDNVPFTFSYDSGRMPLFMKVIWVGFLILATYYIAAFLLTSLGEELSG